MVDRERIRLAMQRSGRLSEKSVALLKKGGIDFEWRTGRLVCSCLDFPLDLMLVRDDDIPEYVHEGVCDAGIVGRNVLEEEMLAGEEKGDPKGIHVERELGFGTCRLSLAVPDAVGFESLDQLQDKRIATSYPAILGSFLRKHGVKAQLVDMSGSVEIAPALGIAEAVCDLVSTGGTLRSNGLREVHTVFESEAVLIRTTRSLQTEQENTLARLRRRIDGVLKAAKSKYIMMHAPRSKVESITKLLPGMDAPTVIDLSGQPAGGGDADLVAVHAVAPEDVFWDTMEMLREEGASSILVLPIEKIID